MPQQASEIGVDMGAFGRSWLLCGCAIGVAVFLSVGAVAAPLNGKLIDAVKREDAKAVRALLKQKVDVNEREPDGARALHWAVQRDALEIADLLIRAGADVNPSNDYGITPLALAAANANAVMVERLLKAGANPNAATPSGETVIMTAARTGKTTAVELLLAYGADVNARETSRGQTALMWAVSQGHLATAKSLMAHGAEVRARSISGFTPLLFAARGGDIELVRLLLGAGADINEVSGNGEGPLLVATVRGHTPLALWLLDHGADPNELHAGYTPLHWAAGRWESTLTGEYQDAEAPSPELVALNGVQTGKIELIKALFAHGANPKARITRPPARVGFSLSRAPRPGATAFFLAALVADVDVMKLLLAHGADPLIPASDDTTPLIAAAGIGRFDGESLATEPDHVAAVALTLQLGNNVNAANTVGNTALHEAAIAGLERVIQLLVDSGARVNAKNRDDETPLKLAEGFEYSSMRFERPGAAALLRTLGGTSW